MIIINKDCSDAQLALILATYTVKNLTSSLNTNIDEVIKRRAEDNLKFLKENKDL
jgi:hypothetical protein